MESDLRIGSSLQPSDPVPIDLDSLIEDLQLTKKYCLVVQLIGASNQFHHPFSAGNRKHPLVNLNSEAKKKDQRKKREEMRERKDR